MKFVTFVADSRPAAPGVLLEDLSTIVDLSDQFTDILALLDAGEAGLAQARQAAVAAQNTVQLADVKLLAPLPNPRRLRDCALFEEHMLGGARWAEKMGIQHLAKVPDIWYQQPIYYKGNHLAISGPEAEIVMPSYAKLLDYELELGIVIGKPGKNISKETALDHLFGFVIFNDLSVRNVAMGELSGGLGPAKAKDFDGANIIGPWLVTKDEIPDIYDMNMRARHNGETMGKGGNTRDLYHKWDVVIAHASQDETLHPGEIIGSGTVGGGTLIEFGKGLQPGDVIEFEIDGLGILRNRIAG